MNGMDKKWAFTEFLGNAEDVQCALGELRECGLLVGNVSGNEVKGNKRFVQYYVCGTEVSRLEETVAEVYNRIAVAHHVCIEYTFMGQDCQSFPRDGKDTFSVKYWEWWIAD